MQEPKDKEPYFTKSEVTITFLTIAVLSTALFLITLTAYILTGK